MAGRAGLRRRAVGIFKHRPRRFDRAQAGGDVGFLVANVKKISDAKIRRSRVGAPDPGAVSWLPATEAHGLAGWYLLKTRVRGLREALEEAASDRSIVFL